MEKIGIIGAGNIGMAIAKGLVSQKVIAPSNLYLSRRRNELLSGKKKEGFLKTWYKKPCVPVFINFDSCETSKSSKAGCLPFCATTF